MSVEAVLRRLVEEVINTGDVALADELVAQDLVMHRLGLSGTTEAFGPEWWRLSDGVTGLERFKQATTRLREAFPDWRHEIDTVVEQGDLAMARWTTRATHRGEFMGIAPTGREISFQMAALVRVSGGQLAEGWFLGDELGLIRQLGGRVVGPDGAESPVVERNKATFRLLQEEVINRGRIELAEQVFAPTLATRRAGMADLMDAAGEPYPRDGNVYQRFRRAYDAMVRVLGDQERTIEEIHGEGDTVWARWRIRATHTGEYLGCPPTGRRLEWSEVGVMRFDDDGRMVDGWFLCDELNLARQLGLALMANGTADDAAG